MRNPAEKPGDPEPGPGPDPSPEGTEETGPGRAGRRIPAASSRPSLGRLALLFYGVLFGVALLWSTWAGTPLFFASEADVQRGLAPARDLLAGLLAGAVVIGISQRLTHTTGWGERLARTLAAVLGRLSWRACIGLALLSGVAEEAFFRGLLQPRVGLVAASLLFGLAHFAPSRDLLPWTVFSVLAGLGFGALFDATGNLLAPITAHALINAVNLHFLSAGYAPRE